MERVVLSTRSLNQRDDTEAPPPPPPAPDFTKTFTRNKADRVKQSQIEKDNDLYFKKLASIRREGPAAFHAPNGLASLRVRPCKCTGCPPRDLPHLHPRPPSHR